MPPIVINIHTSSITARLKYVLDWVFTERWGIDWIHASDHQNDGINLYYGPQPRPQKGIIIPRSTLLYETTIIDQRIQIEHDPNNKLFFYKLLDLSDSNTWQFDLFACIFYLISRYEEYLPHDKDEHSRFTHRSSLAYQHDFLDYPLVDYWVELLRKQINQVYDYNIPTKRQFSNLPTIDIDIPYAYRYMGLKKWLALGRDLLYLRGTRVRHRLQSLKQAKDPFDSYDYLLSRLPVRSLFFFLMNNEPPYDENHLCDHPEMQKLIRHITKHHKVGLHPSYQSHVSNQGLTQEHQKLQEKADQPIDISRQHFLKMTMPKTYQQLIQLGIKADHSMIYAGRSGFRASTCHPFYWYDLQNDRTTDLMIYSPCTMDVTLRLYEDLDPVQAIEKADRLRRHVMEYNGIFSFIWHNSSFSAIHGWEHWDKVFEHLISIDSMAVD